MRHCTDADNQALLDNTSLTQVFRSTYKLSWAHAYANDALVVSKYGHNSVVGT